MSTTNEIQKTQLVPLTQYTYGVREGLTVTISQRDWQQKAKGNTPWEAQAVFEDTKTRQSVVLWLPVLQQIAGFCGYPVDKPVDDWDQELRGERYKDQYAGMVRHEYAPEASYKYYIAKEGGSKLEVTIYDNHKIEVEDKFYEREPAEEVTILLADVLAVLELIPLVEILEQKTFVVGEHNVLVRRQNDHDEEKPLQVAMQTEVAGVTIAVTGSYPEACIVNRDSDYANFDDEKAAKFVASHQRFLTQFEGDSSVEPEEVFALLKEDEEDERDCPFCGGFIHSRTEICANCGLVVGEDGNERLPA